jgi:hydrogenase nickel incorporation protein HypA/HybF
MHELGITQEIIDIVTQQSRGAKVTRVVLHIGKLSAVLPDAVRFCFDLCSEGTVAEGAHLEIIETAGRARCRQCAAEVELLMPFGRCRCGSSDLDWLSGEELKIQEMEVV